MGKPGEKVRRACSDLCSSFTRTKTLDVDHIQESELKRCLSVFDLVALGVGATLGAGIYVLTAQVAKSQAGPAVVVSFLIAAVASLLAGICYAEFAARVPKAGSAYVYSYVSVGEAWAFVIGWNMLLENMIGAASVGKAWSQYFDSLINDTIQRSILENVGGFHSPGLAGYPDFLAFALLLVVTFLVSLGVKMSSVVSLFLTVLNLVVIACIIAVGAFYTDGRNWTDDPGFFPFGFRGVLSGAATCFYAFVGFDVIATSGEEARHPTQNIPMSIMATLVVCFLAYFGVATVVTLMVPWYKLADTAALPKVFAQHGVYGAEYVIAVGGICGLSASMLGCVFPMPRLLYALANDGLVFRFLGSVNSWTNTPFVATWVCGILAAVMALLIDLDGLIQMMSIGTLMAYTLVAVSVLTLRYQREQVGLTAADMYEVPDETLDKQPEVTSKQEVLTEDSGLLRVGDQVRAVKYTPKQETTVFKRVQSQEDENDATGSGPDRSKREVLEEVRTKREQEVLNRMASYMDEDTPPDSTYQRVGSNYSLNSLTHLFNFGEENTQEPTEQSRRIANGSIIALMVIWVSLCLLTVYGSSYVDTAEWWTILLLCLFCASLLILLIVLARQPRNPTKLNFKVPLVPLIPMASVMVNIYLMITLSGTTWVRFSVWMVLGAAIYLGYGVHNSSERRRSEDQEVILYDLSDRENILGEHR